MANETVIRYWLAGSAVRFTGTVTTADATRGNTAPPARVAKASLVTVADRTQTSVGMTLPAEISHDSKFGLKFSEDGRLTSSHATSTSDGAQIVGAVASLAGEAAAAIVHLPAALPAAESASANEVQSFLDDDQTHDLETSTIAVANPYGQAPLLESVTKREDDVTAQLTTPSDPPRTLDQVNALSAELDLLAGQRTRLTAEKTAWEAVGTTVATYDITIPVTAIPTEAGLVEALASRRDPKLRTVWNKLGLTATIGAYAHDADIESPHGYDGAAPFQPAVSPSGVHRHLPPPVVWYRRPRPAQLVIWQRETCDDDVVHNGEVGDDGSGPAPLPHEVKQRVLVSRTDIDILDKHCRHFQVPLGKDGLFEGSDISATFGDNGTPTALNIDETSALGNILKTISGGPKAFTTGLGDVSAAETAYAGLKPDPAAAELASLTAQRDKLKILAEIAKLTPATKSS